MTSQTRRSTCRARAFRLSALVTTGTLALVLTAIPAYADPLPTPPTVDASLTHPATEALGKQSECVAGAGGAAHDVSTDVAKALDFVPANPPELAPPAPPVDTDDPGYAVMGGGVDILLTGCAPDSVVIGTDGLAADDNVVSVTAVGDVVIGATDSLLPQQDPGDGGGHYQVTYTGLKLPFTAHGEYAQKFGAEKADSYGAHWEAFDTSYPDRRGRMMVWFQKADVSMRHNGDQKIYYAVSQLWHRNGPNVAVLDTSPTGSVYAEHDEGRTVSFKVGGQVDGTGPNADIGVSTTVGIERTTYGGLNYRWDAKDGKGQRVYGTEGGFMNIAHCYRSDPRAWAQGMTLLIPRNAKPAVQSRVYISNKNRPSSESTC